MGIQGLTSFIDANSHLLTDFKLHDTKVVIDGNNLFHFLYYHFSIGTQFGGDYDVYAKGVRFYFERLRECNVEPYVVFDGAYPPDDRKLKTSLKRAADRLNSARLLAKGEVANVLPLLANETFHSILIELQVKHMTCEFEADTQLTALANELQCPVMSNDSDFYIYDVQGGFILFDYMNLEKHTETLESSSDICYLKVQIYYLDNFVNNFTGITRDEVPLFASLLGNDYISRQDLEPFYTETKVSKQMSKKYGTQRRFERITRLLAWLESEENVSSAMASVFKCYKANQRDRIQRQLKLSVNEYQSHSSRPLQFEFQNSDQLSPTPDQCSENGTIAGHVLPRWVLINVQHGLIPVMCLNVVVSNRIILPPQVEDMRCCSSYQCSIKLRQIIYTLLLMPGEGHPVTEYDRGDGSLRKTEVPTLGNSEESLGATTLHGIPSLSIAERLQKLLHFLSISKAMYVQIKDLVNEKRILPFLAMIYWVENARPAVLDIHFKALLLSFVKVKLDAEHQIVETKVAEKSVSQAENTGNQVDTVMEKLRNLCNRQKMTLYNSSITHAFAQYQTCLQAALCLNRLLMSPLENPNPACFMNGTFLYNLSRHLLNRKCPDMYIQEILGRDSELFCKFTEVVQCLTECLSSKDKLLANIGNAKQKKSKKQKSAATKVRDEGRSSMDASSSEETDTAERTNNVKLLCSTNNKFTLLSVD